MEKDMVFGECQVWFVLTDKDTVRVVFICNAAVGKSYDRMFS